MDSCCEAKSSEIAALRESQGRVLKIVLAINLAMFVFEFAAGLYSRSAALLADSLDMLGDAFVYAFSLYVLHKSEKWRAAAAILKGLIMLAFGIGATVEVVRHVLSDSVPLAATMGWVGALALAANGACLYLLTRHRRDDINMKSTWECSRNDIIANSGVLVAAALVALTGSKWPDIAVGAVVGLVFYRSAGYVLWESVAAYRRAS